MLDKIVHNKYLRIITGVIGTLIMSFALNLIITPLGLYSGGLYGVCQVIRTLLVENLGIHFGNIDIAGIMYYVMNIPVFILAYKSFGKEFVFRLLITLTSFSAFSAFIPSPATPFVSDPLTGCLIGGMLCGFGSGLVLTCGCSTGGLDVLGLFLSKKGSSFTVGKFCVWFNALLYLACALIFSLETAVYSIIYTVFNSLFLDRIHQQNITVQVLVFTKDKTDAIPQTFIKKLNRGCTYWEGRGAYTGDDVRVICVCLSKYEITTARQLLHEIDPDAFLIVQEGVYAGGYFPKHLQ